MRPVGGVAFGYLSDRHGRVRSLRVSMCMMALPTCAIAFLPGYAVLGWPATALLVLVRMLQARGAALSSRLGPLCVPQGVA
jgi:MHS family proline/betaine transporter-like MFS transporter